MVNIMNEKYFKCQILVRLHGKNHTERYCAGLGLVKGKCRLNLDKWKRIGLQTMTQKVEEISNEIIMQDVSLQRKKGCG